MIIYFHVINWDLINAIINMYIYLNLINISGENKFIIKSVSYVTNFM